MAIYSVKNPLPIAVLISGTGSNLQAIIDAIATGLAATIKVVISNNVSAFGLERAQKAGIPTVVLNHKDYANREEYDAALIACLEKYQPQLIILAGFMRILSSHFVKHFQNRILNIHPSLLPKFPGLNTHQLVLSAQEVLHGTTVHVVTEGLDAGPIIAQASCKIDANDDAASLKAKVQQLEHKLYPYVIGLYAQEKLELQEDQILFEGNPLPSTGLQL